MTGYGYLPPVIPLDHPLFGAGISRHLILQCSAAILEQREAAPAP